ncbi:Hypothetical_protein [Hexamita inflata]|uniref:Hypothetical_protein n=1 Tax=Hexamita inflata TaxID=28002 RepID=A0AA86V3V0_9EUKA|nr:Hypothetical protein HINF_LOCUS62837 [Hexamita inflata]
MYHLVLKCSLSLPERVNLVQFCLLNEWDLVHNRFGVLFLLENVESRSCCSGQSHIQLNSELHLRAVCRCDGLQSLIMSQRFKVSLYCCLYLSKSLPSGVLVPVALVLVLIVEKERRFHILLFKIRSFMVQVVLVGLSVYKIRTQT